MKIRYRLCNIIVTEGETMDDLQNRIKLKQDQLKEIVRSAISAFNDKEKYLIENDLSERCICARFAMYLEDALRNTDYCNFVVDVEYNRGAMGKERGTKKLDAHPITVDLIVHKRAKDPMTGFQNLVCMEMKKSTDRRGCVDDINRLTKLCCMDYSFCYTIGFMLLINMTSNCIEIKETILLKFDEE